MAQLSDTDTSEETPVVDELRDEIVAKLRSDLGDAVIDVHQIPCVDLWVRVSADAWRATGEALRAQGFDYFCFLSAMDWMPSPFGTGENDPTDEVEDDPSASEVRQGYAGGETRFQMLARVTDLRRHVSITLKADVPEASDGSMSIDSWISVYAGANWHERETHEMFGINFAGHPDLRNMYLPGDFEGYPLRKDFPLLARLVKPWPGIVDVEPMPASDDDEGDDS